MTLGNTRHFGTKKIQKRRKETEWPKEARTRVKCFKIQWRFKKKKRHGLTDSNTEVNPQVLNKH